MGKDYSSGNYIKTYGAEYVKSYSLNSQQQSAYNETVKEYNKVSKKIGTRSYSKAEKEAFDGLYPSAGEQTGSVNAEGRRKPIQKDIKQKLHRAESADQKPKVVENTPPTNATISFDKVKTPPPYKDKDILSEDEPPKPKHEVKPKVEERKESVDGYNYIDQKAVSNPIRPLADGNYVNNYTQEIVDGDEARRILMHAGYTSKELMKIGLLFIVMIIVGYRLLVVGPVVFILWGIYTTMRKMTTMEKFIGGVILKCPVPADSEELSSYKKRGTLYLFIGILMAILQFTIEIPSFSF